MKSVLTEKNKSETRVYHVAKRPWTERILLCCRGNCQRWIGSLCYGYHLNLTDGVFYIFSSTKPACNHFGFGKKYSNQKITST